MKRCPECERMAEIIALFLLLIQETDPELAKKCFDALERGKKNEDTCVR